MNGWAVQKRFGFDLTYHMDWHGKMSGSCKKFACFFFLMRRFVEWNRGVCVVGSLGVEKSVPFSLFFLLPKFCLGLV
jgi:hypothetical protein